MNKYQEALTQLPDPHICVHCGELTMRPYGIRLVVGDHWEEDWICVECYGRAEYHYDRINGKYMEDENGRIKDFGSD